MYCKEDGRRYAVKRALDAFRSSADRSLKLREVQKHELLPKHINLVQFYKAWEEKWASVEVRPRFDTIYFASFSGRLYILTELCEKSLLDYCTELHTVPENEIWNIFIDLLRVSGVIFSSLLIAWLVGVRVWLNLPSQVEEAQDWMLTRLQHQTELQWLSVV